MPKWLLDRLLKNSEKAKYVFDGTVNWMSALAIIVELGDVSDEKLKVLYERVERRKVDESADNRVFECMLMAYHSYASLFSLKQNGHKPYDVCKTAIVTWYYLIYFSAKAMIASSSGSFQETHTATSKMWQTEIVQRGLMPYPFDLNLSSLVSSTVNDELDRYGYSSAYPLKDRPSDRASAHGGLLSYLKGSCEHERKKCEGKVKNFKEFKKLSVDTFRTKKAKELRDREFQKTQINFLVQAFRYRGKANYRDAIYLSYGLNREGRVLEFLGDLERVGRAFMRSAAYYSSKRVERGLWDLFVEDIEKNARLSIGTEILKI